MGNENHGQQSTSWQYLDHPSAMGFNHLGKWYIAVAQQAERVLDATRPMTQRQTDGYLFVLALRQVLRAAYMIFTGLEEEAKQQQAGVAHAAIEAFEVAVPDAKNARDVLDHFDDYARGLGNLSHPGVSRNRRIPTEESARSFNVFYEIGGEGHYILHLGPLAIDVAAAEKAAEVLFSEMHTAVGLEAVEQDDVVADFAPYVESNPAYVGLAFYARVCAEPSQEIFEQLCYLATPESIPHWGDFRDARLALSGYSLTSGVHYLDENTAYVKLIPEVDRVRQVRNDDGLTIIDPRFITLQRRPELNGAWRVFSAGARFHRPDEIPPAG